MQTNEYKDLLQKGCSEYIRELQDNMTKLMEMYKGNPTFPIDFYNLALREADTRIQAVRDLYRRLMNEDLEQLQ